jgi:coenzyme F420-reducing hydrogenase alpha subunit
VFPAGEYARILAERSVEHSYAKESCADGGACFVGAAARARLAAARAGRQVDGEDNIYCNNTAQLDEIEWALGRAFALTEAILGAEDGGDLLTAPGPPQGGVGTAVMEAPRGLLVHHYVIDEWGYVAAADVVTPTAINQRAMQVQILADLAEETDPERMRPVVERIVRAFDPCISCAVHLLQI